MVDTVSSEFVRIGSAENFVACDLGRDNLADNIVIGEADDETVLGSIVLILCLGDQALAGIVVGLTSPTTFILGLIPATAMLDNDCCIFMRYATYL